MMMNLFGVKVNLATVLVSLVLGLVIGASLLCSCSNLSVKEGLQMIGAKVGYNMSDGVPGDTWADIPGQKYNQKSIYALLKDNKGGKVPLPKGELDFFYANKFDLSCCFKPQTYSSSTGCACISVDQMKYLNERGGNNTL